MKHNSTGVELNSNCRAELCTLYPLQEHDNIALHAVATSNRTSREPGSAAVILCNVGTNNFIHQSTYLHIYIL